MVYQLSLIIAGTCLQMKNWKNMQDKTEILSCISIEA